MRRFMLPLAAALSLTTAGTVSAGEAQDRIFRVGLLDPIETGISLVYRHERAGKLAVGSVPAIPEGSIELEISEREGGRAATVELIEGGQPRSRAVLSATGGHPVLLIFFETTARNVAALTGGNPFYIKNRMREALAAEVPVEPVDVVHDAEQVPAFSITFRPFENDPNQAELGAFAKLELTMVLSEAVPGEVARLVASAAPADGGAPAFAETITFDHLGDG